MAKVLLPPTTDGAAVCRSSCCCCWTSFGCSRSCSCKVCVCVRERANTASRNRREEGEKEREVWAEWVSGREGQSKLFNHRQSRQVNVIAKALNEKCCKVNMQQGHATHGCCAVRCGAELGRTSLRLRAMAVNQRAVSEKRKGK